MNESNGTGIQGFSIELGTGQGITIPEGYRMVKVASSPEKGKRGKGKVFAFSLIPTPLALTVADFDTVSSMVHSLCVELQKDIVCRIAKAGTKMIGEDELSVAACAAEFAARTFSEESIGTWYDENMGELVALDYMIHKGYDPETLTEAQKVEITQINNVWRSAYAEFGKRFPSIASDMRPKLLARIGKYELDDAIAARLIRELTPKVTADALGDF